MKEIILIRGVPGAGKTTLAMLLKSLCEKSCVAVSADDFFTAADGTYNFDGHLIEEAHMFCQEVTKVSMETEVELILVHNTFTRDREMKPYFELAEAYGYNIKTIVVENRHGNKSVHDVPERTIEAMKNRFSISL